MLQLSKMGSWRLPIAALAMVIGWASVAAAQCINCGHDGCNKYDSCATCPTVPGIDPSKDPDEDSKTDPIPIDPDTVFSPLQSSLTTPETIAFTPNMIGHLLRAYRGVTFQYLLAGDFATTNSSGSVSFRNTNVAENNSAIPRNRVSFRYNYFHNALTVRGLRDTGPVPSILGTPQLFFGVNPALYDLDAVAAVVGESRVARGVGLGSQNALDGELTTLNGVAAAARDYDVHLYTFAVERTFYDDLMSIEVRVPYADTLSEDQDFTSGVVREDYLAPATPGRTLGSSGGEFQDIQIILKGILVQDHSNGWTISAGLGLTLPTGPDLNASVTDFSFDIMGDPGDQFPGNVNANVTPFGGFSADLRTRDFKTENETYSLSPFLAAVATPNNRTFFNGFAQLDVPLNESDWQYSSIDTDLGDLGLLGLVPGVGGFRGPAAAIQNIEQFNGSMRDQTLLQLDIGGGYWLYQNPCARLVTGVASILELHYTTTLQDADIVTVPAARLTGLQGGTPEPSPRLGNIANRVDILDLTVGGHFQLGNRATLAVGGVFPLRDGNDRTFDAELNVQFNIYH